MLLNFKIYLEERSPHLNATGFSLITAGDNATVIITQYHYRNTIELGFK